MTIPLLDALAEGVRREPATALLVGAGAYLLLFVLVLWSLVRSHRNARRQAHLWRGADGTSLEQMLMGQMDEAQSIRSQIAQNAERGTANAETLHHCLQRVGLVRYDAFPGVGGEQSFSLAVLDAGGNGLVMSGLFGRQDMRIYAKPVNAGVSSLALTDEEREAILRSRQGGPVPETAAASGGRR